MIKGLRDWHDYKVLNQECFEPWLKDYTIGMIIKFYIRNVLNH